MSNFSFLSPDDIPDMLKLQAAVIESLKLKGQEHFIIARETSYFEKHAQNPSAILGVRSSEGKLIAQSIFHHSDTLNPDYIKGLTLDDWKLCDHVSTLQGVIIHPDAQGQGLSSRMVDAWIGWAQEKGYKHLLTRIEEHNSKSISSFKRAGLEDVGKIVDARDGATVCVLHKTINHEKTA